MNKLPLALGMGLIMMTGLAAEGREWIVRPEPSAIRETMEKAEEGDVLLLQPGVYREFVRLKKGLTLRGLPGAVLDGSTDLQVQWTPAGEDLEGVFTAPFERRPYGLLVEGRFLAEVMLDRASKEGEWHWRTLLTKGPPLSGFEHVRGLWMYHPEEQRIYARFEDGKLPAAQSLAWLPEKKPLVTITGASGAVVEDLTFTRGWTAVAFTDGATESTLRRCRVESYERIGVQLTGGANNCTVERCEITRGSLEDWQPALPWDKATYEVWQIHKSVGGSDRAGIVLYKAGAANRILHNQLDRVFDGIGLGDYSVESLDKPLLDPDHGRGTEIAWNVIENTRDSGIELGVGCIDVNVHHNVLRRTHGGLRFKLPRIGPVFVHHNRFIDGAPFHLWFSMDSAPAEGYVYHNTYMGAGDAAVAYSSFNAQREEATPNFHFLNNLVLGDRGFFRKHRDTPNADFTAAHNVVVDGNPPGDQSSDKGSIYGVEIEHDELGKPAPDSRAIDSGLNLSTYREGKPLPGCEPGYFKGQAPDAGADERD